MYHLDLGDQHLIFHTAPGHTPGNLFVEGLVLHDGAQTYRGIWGGGGLGAPGLAGAEQSVKNAEKLNAVTPAFWHLAALRIFQRRTRRDQPRRKLSEASFSTGFLSLCAGDGVIPNLFT